MENVCTILKNKYMKMKKHRLLMTTGLALVWGASVTGLRAQTYPQLANSDMELWDNAGTSNQEPQHWNSFKTADCTLGGLICGLAQNQQVERSTDVRPGSTGTYSARIFSTNPIGSTIANGNMTTGIIRMGNTAPANAANFNYTKRNDANFNAPINEKPDSMVFWVKYQPGNNSTTNQARMRAVLHDDSDYRDPGGALANEVGNATINFTRTHNGTNYVWQRFSVPFNYSLGQASVPKYMLVTFTTNMNPGGGADNDQVWVDDVRLVYNPKLVTGTVSPLSHYVSASQTSAISVPFTLTGPAGSIPAGNVVTAELSDASGSFAAPVSIGTLATTTSGTISAVIPAGTPAGTGYRIRVRTSTPSIIAADNGTNITIQNISVAVTPNASQSLLVGIAGNTLTATETPAGTAREWKYSTTPGGTYVSFSPAETGTTYTPLFASAGTYYIVCQSTILGTTYTSNEIQITASSITLNTGAITGSPFLFSSSAPAAAVNVPYTVTGGAFLAGNVFTAQLSDASGSFAAPVNIGTTTATGSGSISATIPPTTAAGTAYRIRVVASNPGLSGGDNGSDLVIDQFNNSIAPVAAQTIEVGSQGTTLTVTASQSGTQEWRYATTSGGPYTPFAPGETGTSYTPQFATLGTYFVVAASENTYGDEVLSNEVQVTVMNATTITTTTLSNTTFYISPSAAEQTTVSFTSNVIFNNGNVFTAELSDASGSFAAPLNIGSVTSDLVTTITANIPNNLPDGNQYKIRIVSSDPPITGSVAADSAEVINFALTNAPPESQNLTVNQPGTMLTANSTHPAATIVWGLRENNVFTPFSPAVTGNTYTPVFPAVGNYAVRSRAINQWNDTLESENVWMYVTQGSGLEENANGTVTLYQSAGQLYIDLTAAAFTAPDLSLTDMSGKVLMVKRLQGKAQNMLPAEVKPGVYAFRIYEGQNSISGKILLK